MGQRIIVLPGIGGGRFRGGGVTVDIFSGGRGRQSRRRDIRDSLLLLGALCCASVVI